MKYLILSLMILTGCTATGKKYTNENGKLVVYRTEGLFYAGSLYGLEINGQECNLAVGGYWSVDAKQGDKLTGDVSDMPGTSEITVYPGAFVRVKYKDGYVTSRALGGWIGGAAMTQESGPFTFEVVPANIAERELSELRRDCE